MNKTVRVSLLAATFGIAGVFGAHANVPVADGHRVPGVASGPTGGLDVAVNRAAWGYGTPAKFSNLAVHGRDVAVNRAAWGYGTPAKFSNLAVHGVDVAVNRAAWGYGTPAKFSSLAIHGLDVAVNRAAWGYGTPVKFSGLATSGSSDVALRRSSSAARTLSQG